MSGHIFLGLVHYPVYNKRMETITTSVTNLDIHDIARCAATYNLERYYVIHPLSAQHKLVREIIEYWQQGYGAVYNPDRKQALEVVSLTDSIGAAIAEIKNQWGGTVHTIVTDARTYPNSVSYREMRHEIEAEGDKNYLLLFGTGWGMTREVMAEANYVLEPIHGRGPYNHLSVRSAVSIILDRLLGDQWWI